MKVWLVNGSPHKEGNTNAVLLEIARQLASGQRFYGLEWTLCQAAGLAMPAAILEDASSTIV